MIALDLGSECGTSGTSPCAFAQNSKLNRVRGSGWRGMLLTAVDNGKTKTWSTPGKLGEEPLGPLVGPMRSKPIQLADGSNFCLSKTATLRAVGPLAKHAQRVSARKLRSKRGA